MQVTPSVRESSSLAITMRKNDNNPSEYMTIVTTSVQKEKENKLLPPRVSTAMLYVKEKATKPILQPVS